MPSTALKPCAHPGCSALVANGSRCDQHKVNKTSNWSKPERSSSTARGYGWAWTKLRNRIMHRDGGLCQVCFSAGLIVQAKEVDHIVAKHNGGTDDETNLQAICIECHKLKTAGESALAGQEASFYPEWLPKPKIPVTIVCGPPGSGKSTLANERAGPNDLVIDTDVLATRLFKVPMYHASFDQMKAAIRMRNKLLADLAEKPRYEKAWVVMTGKYDQRRRWWKEKLDAELIVINTDKRVCIERIKTDDRRPEKAKKQAIKAVLDWI